MDILSLSPDDLLSILNSQDFINYWNSFSNKEKTYFLEKILPLITIEDKKKLQNLIYNPSSIDVLSNLKESIKRWKDAGFPIVEDRIFWERISICKGCDHWWAFPKTIIGFCKKCKCTTTKLYLATEQCPLTPPKWKRIN